MPLQQGQETRKQEVIRVCRTARSYECVPLSQRVGLWTVRRTLCDLVGSPVTSLALFVRQKDYAAAVCACSGPLNLLWLSLGVVRAELSFKTGPGITAFRKPTLTPVSLSLCSHCTFCLFPFQHFSHTQLHLFCVFLPHSAALHS